MAAQEKPRVVSLHRGRCELHSLLPKQANHLEKKKFVCVCVSVKVHEIYIFA